MNNQEEKTTNHTSTHTADDGKEALSVPEERPRKESFWNANWEKILAFIGIMLVMFQTILMWQQTKLSSRQTDISAQQTKIAIEQSILSQDPLIAIFPEKIIKADNRIFEISIKNTGVPDISNVRIYVDYFVAIKDKNNSVTLNRPGGISDEPDHHIYRLFRGASATINLDLNTADKRISEAYPNYLTNGSVRVLRLLIKFQRGLDEKEFNLTKVYNIVAGTVALFDLDDRGIKPPPPFAPAISYDEIKSILTNSHKPQNDH